MNKKELTHKQNLLYELYGYKKEEILKMSKEEIDSIIILKQKQEINKIKNPNKFWILNGLPEPKEYIPTTHKKWGALIVISLFLVLFGFFGMFMFMALYR